MGWLHRNAWRHAWFLVVFAAGVGLRVVTLLAYRPALLTTDSIGYLAEASRLHPGVTRPSGYSVLLAPLPLHGHLALVPLAQHLLGLVMGVVVYAAVLRLVARPWVATLAAAPVLLDAYQLNIEQYVMSETVFQAELLAACVLLACLRPRRLASAAGTGLAVGLLVGAAAVTRTAGVPMVVAAAVLTPVVWWRPRVRVAAAATGALLIGAGAILGGYLVWFHRHYDAYALTLSSGHFLYARVAGFADCRQFTVPAYERPLCETTPPGHRLEPAAYVWGASSPARRVVPPPGETLDQVLRDFARRVVLGQPVRYAGSVARNVVDIFGPTKDLPGTGRPERDWQFRPAFYEAPSVAAAYDRFGVRHLRISRAAARLLDAYQNVGYTPGPLLAVGVLAPLLAVLGVGAARSSPLLRPAVVFAGMAVTLVVATAAGAWFSWRFSLPQLVLLPPAAACALTALVDRAGHPAEPGPRRSLRDRDSADWVGPLGSLRRLRAERVAGLRDVPAVPQGPGVGRQGMVGLLRRLPARRDRDQRSR